MTLQANTAWDWTALGLHLREAQKHTDAIVMSTPTGDTRNDATELNIDLLRLIDKYTAFKRRAEE